MAAFDARGGVVEIIECDGEEERTMGAVTAITPERETRKRKRGSDRTGYR